MQTERAKEQPLWEALVGTACVAVGGPLSLEFVFFFTGIGGARRAWLWAPAITAAALGVAGWLVWQRPAGRTPVVAGLAAIGVVYGSWVPSHHILSVGALRAEMDALFPIEHDSVDDSGGGNWLCFDECPGLSRTWIVPGDVETARAAFDDLLRRQGVELGPWTPYGGVEEGMEAKGRHHRVGLSVRILDRANTSMGTERVPVPPGHVEVTASLGTR